MDLSAFRGLVCAMTVLLYIVYFINWGFTMWVIVDGSLIFGKTEDGIDSKGTRAEEEGRCLGVGTAIRAVDLDS